MGNHTPGAEEEVLMRQVYDAAAEPDQYRHTCSNPAPRTQVTRTPPPPLPSPPPLSAGCLTTVLIWTKCDLQITKKCALLVTGNRALLFTPSEPRLHCWFSYFSISFRCFTIFFVGNLVLELVDLSCHEYKCLFQFRLDREAGQASTLSLRDETHPTLYTAQDTW